MDAGPGEENIPVSRASESSGDDNESWTVIDEVEDDRLLEDNSQDQQEEDNDETLTTNENLPEDNDENDHSDNDSDIEALDDGPQENEGGPESILSDGIPVGNDLGADAHQYIWSSEEGMEEQMFETIVKAPLKIPDLTSQYPSEELPERFSEIKKGHTYIHQRNQSLNMVLSFVLVIFIALTLGLGVGNFLGWSSRIELHVQFAEVQDEKLEELTDSLVTCMTGVEGQGGDDQDLDDRVIQHLSEENRRLKEELEVIKDGKEMGFSEELTVILQDRINDLQVANAGLERELLKLKNSAKNEGTLERTMYDLEKTKASLNDIAAENAQLKIEIGKARYGNPTPNFTDERKRLEILESENHLLRKQVEEIHEKNMEQLKQARVLSQSTLPKFENEPISSESPTLDSAPETDGDLDSESFIDENSNKEISNKALEIKDQDREKFDNDIIIIRKSLEKMIDLYGNSTSHFQTVVESLEDSENLQEDEQDEIMLEIIKIESLSVQLTELQASVNKILQSPIPYINSHPVFQDLATTVKKHAEVLGKSDISKGFILLPEIEPLPLQKETLPYQEEASSPEDYDFEENKTFEDEPDPFEVNESTFGQAKEGMVLDESDPKNGESVYHYQWKWEQRLSPGDWLFNRAEGRKDFREKRHLLNHKFEKKCKSDADLGYAFERPGHWVFNRAKGRRELRGAIPRDRHDYKDIFGKKFEECSQKKRSRARTKTDKPKKPLHLGFDFKAWSRKMKNKFRHYEDKFKTYFNSASELYTKSFRPRR